MGSSHLRGTGHQGSKPPNLSQATGHIGLGNLIHIGDSTQLPEEATGHFVADELMRRPPGPRLPKSP